MPRPQGPKTQEETVTSLEYPIKGLDNVELNDEFDYLKFKMLKKGRGGNESTDSGNQVKLFIPAGSLNYSRSFTYSAEEQQITTEGLSEIGKFINGEDSQVMSGIGKSILRGIGASLQAIPGLSQAAGRKGFAYNPNMEVFFKIANFRKFNFTFPFLPKSEKESLQVRNIVRFFERYSHPEIKSKYLFRYPKTWKISGGGGDLNFSSKECVIENFEVSYGADTGYVTFKNGMPVMTTLKISFMEIELYTQEELPL